jgi:3-oxoacyl-[acyl-carrier protein] reductase
VTLQGTQALVTGASRGIGRAIALLLAREGAEVTGTATTQAGAMAIDAAFTEHALAGNGAVLDVSSSESVERLFATLRQRSFEPGIIVNNAGITRDGLLARMSESDWQSVLDTNLGSLYRVCRAAVRHLMRSRGGRIVNITSVVASLGNAGQTNYAAAKAGMEGFTRALARELASRNVTVNAVAPGFIETDMTRSLAPEQRAALVGQIPLGRLGTAEEVAEAVRFLVSPAAGYITGETLHVNGGMYMS